MTRKPTWYKIYLRGRKRAGEILVLAAKCPDRLKACEILRKIEKGQISYEEAKKALIKLSKQ